MTSYKTIRLTSSVKRDFNSLKRQFAAEEDRDITDSDFLAILIGSFATPVTFKKEEDC